MRKPFSKEPTCDKCLTQSAGHKIHYVRDFANPMVPLKVIDEYLFVTCLKCGARFEMDCADKGSK